MEVGFFAPSRTDSIKALEHALRAELTASSESLAFPFTFSTWEGQQDRETAPAFLILERLLRYTIGVVVLQRADLGKDDPRLHSLDKRERKVFRSFNEEQYSSFIEAYVAFACKNLVPLIVITDALGADGQHVQQDEHNDADGTSASLLAMLRRCERKVKGPGRLYRPCFVLRSQCLNSLHNDIPSLRAIVDGVVQHVLASCHSAACFHKCQHLPPVESMVHGLSTLSIGCQEDALADVVKILVSRNYVAHKEQQKARSSPKPLPSVITESLTQPAQQRRKGRQARGRSGPVQRGATSHAPPPLPAVLQATRQNTAALPKEATQPTALANNPRTPPAPLSNQATVPPSPVSLHDAATAPNQSAPLIINLHGPQGCGKSVVMSSLLRTLRCSKDADRFKVGKAITLQCSFNTESHERHPIISAMCESLGLSRLIDGFGTTIGKVHHRAESILSNFSFRKNESLEICARFHQPFARVFSLHTLHHKPVSVPNQHLSHVEKDIFRFNCDYFCNTEETSLACRFSQGTLVRVVTVLPHVPVYIVKSQKTGAMGLFPGIHTAKTAHAPLGRPSAAEHLANLRSPVASPTRTQRKRSIRADALVDGLSTVDEVDSMRLRGARTHIVSPAARRGSPPQSSAAPTSRSNGPGLLVPQSNAPDLNLSRLNALLGHAGLLSQTAQEWRSPPSSLSPSPARSASASPSRSSASPGSPAMPPMKAASRSPQNRSMPQTQRGRSNTYGGKEIERPETFMLFPPPATPGGSGDNVDDGHDDDDDDDDDGTAHVLSHGSNVEAGRQQGHGRGVKGDELEAARSPTISVTQWGPDGGHDSNSSSKDAGKVGATSATAHKRRSVGGGRRRSVTVTTALLSTMATPISPQTTEESSVGVDAPPTTQPSPSSAFESDEALPRPSRHSRSVAPHEDSSTLRAQSGGGHLSPSAKERKQRSRAFSHGVLQSKNDRMLLEATWCQTTVAPTTRIFTPDGHAIPTPHGMKKQAAAPSRRTSAARSRRPSSPSLLFAPARDHAQMTPSSSLTSIVDSSLLGAKSTTGRTSFYHQHEQHRSNAFIRRRSSSASGPLWRIGTVITPLCSVSMKACRVVTRDFALPPKRQVRVLEKRLPLALVGKLMEEKPRAEEVQPGSSSPSAGELEAGALQEGDDAACADTQNVGDDQKSIGVGRERDQPVLEGQANEYLGKKEKEQGDDDDDDEDDDDEENASARKVLSNAVSDAVSRAKKVNKTARIHIVDKLISPDVLQGSRCWKRTECLLLPEAYVDICKADRLFLRESACHPWGEKGADEAAEEGDSATVVEGAVHEVPALLSTLNVSVAYSSQAGSFSARLRPGDVLEVLARDCDGLVEVECCETLERGFIPKDAICSLDMGGRRVPTSSEIARTTALRDAFNHASAALAPDERIYVVLDDFHTVGSSLMSILPDKLPPNVVVVVATRIPIDDTTIAGADVCRVSLPSLTAAQSRQFVEATASSEATFRSNHPTRLVNLSHGASSTPFVVPTADAEVDVEADAAEPLDPEASSSSSMLCMYARKNKPLCREGISRAVTDGIASILERENNKYLSTLLSHELAALAGDGFFRDRLEHMAEAAKRALPSDQKGAADEERGASQPLVSGLCDLFEFGVSIAPTAEGKQLHTAEVISAIVDRLDGTRDGDSDDDCSSDSDSDSEGDGEEDSQSDEQSEEEDDGGDDDDADDSEGEEGGSQQMFDVHTCLNRERLFEEVRERHPVKLFLQLVAASEGRLALCDMVPLFPSVEGGPTADFFFHIAVSQCRHLIFEHGRCGFVSFRHPTIRDHILQHYTQTEEDTEAWLVLRTAIVTLLANKLAESAHAAQRFSLEIVDQLQRIDKAGHAVPLIVVKVLGDTLASLPTHLKEMAQNNLQKSVVWTTLKENQERFIKKSLAKVTSGASPRATARTLTRANRKNRGLGTPPPLAGPALLGLLEQPHQQQQARKRITFALDE